MKCTAIFGMPSIWLMEKLETFPQAFSFEKSRIKEIGGTTLISWVCNKRSLAPKFYRWNSAVISVVITELFKINRCFVFAFLYIFNIPQKSLFRFRRKQHWLQFSVMYFMPNQQFILFHIGGEYRRNVTCLAILFLNKLGGLLRLIHHVGVVRILSPKFPLFRTAPLFHVNCTTKDQLNNIFLAKFPNWRGFCGGNHWTLFLQPTWKYEHRMVYLSKLSIKTSMFRALSLASGAWPDRGRPGSKPGLKAGVSTARGRALAGLAKG